MYSSFIHSVVLFHSHFSITLTQFKISSGTTRSDAQHHDQSLDDSGLWAVERLAKPCDYQHEWATQPRWVSGQSGMKNGYDCNMFDCWLNGVKKKKNVYNIYNFWQTLHPLRLVLSLLGCRWMTCAHGENSFQEQSTSSLQQLCSLEKTSRGCTQSLWVELIQPTHPKTAVDHILYILSIDLLGQSLLLLITSLLKSLSFKLRKITNHLDNGH